jgi:hypothetical protein
MFAFSSSSARSKKHRLGQADRVQVPRERLVRYLSATQMRFRDPQKSHLPQSCGRWRFWLVLVFLLILGSALWGILAEYSYLVTP